MIQYRPYQEEALTAVRNQLRDHHSTLLVMATGLGKTVVFAQYAAEMLEHGRIMVLAHREELVHQAWSHLQTITGEQPDIEMADWHSSMGPGRPSSVVVGTIQTQVSGMKGLGRMTKFDPDDFSLLVIDEAHHAAAKTYRKVVDYYRQNSRCKILGVTATPDRADEKALGVIFKSCAYEYGIHEGVEDGWLVSPEVYMKELQSLDYSWVKTVAGDLNLGEVSEEVERHENVYGMSHHVLDAVGDKKTLIFAASLRQAGLITEILNGERPDSADFVHGKTSKDDRRRMFARYARKEFQFLVNVGVATEGFDDPGIECICQGRPTLSRALYAQCLGRGTRTLPGTIDGLNTASERKDAIRDSGKPDLTVLDFVGNSGRHRLVSAVDVLGGDCDEEVVDRARRKARTTRGDVLTLLQTAETEIAAEIALNQRQKSRRMMEVRAKYSTAKVNPFDTLDLCPVREKSWHVGRTPTEKQVAFLQKAGVDTGGLTFTHASQIIDTVIKRRNDGRCTYKQARLLKKFGYDPTSSFAEAREIIDALAANKWKRPT
jgi:superfamily II DNA or RNA helicase